MFIVSRLWFVEIELNCAKLFHCHRRPTRQIFNLPLASGRRPHVSFVSVLQNIERQTVFSGGPKIFRLQENPGFLVLFVCILLFCKENKLPDQKKFHKPQKELGLILGPENDVLQ